MPFRAAGCLIAVVLLAGCAAHRSPAAREPVVSLEAFISKVRQLALEARPPRKDDAATIERTDPALAAARLLLQTAPTPENYRRVGDAYARLGVRDAAYDHFAAAIRLDPRDAGSLDGLARIWRDWGFPERGLGSAYRAVAFAPNEPAHRNTLGTLLVSLSQPAAARAVFEGALALAPGATYLLNNLCYTAVLEGDGARAIARCHAAVDADPDSRAARNNLALAYAATGDFAAASHEFMQQGNAAAERYNMGVAFFAVHEYREAAAAFEAAAALRPSFRLARQRAQQARDMLAAPIP